jgi:predicted nucleic acid-binding Zn ribbon protein
MPTYSFKHKETGEETEVVIKMSELMEYKENNPLLELVISGGALCRSINIGNGINKDGGFKEVLQNIHRRTPGSCLDKTTVI